MKSALVTGANRGLGFGIVAYLSRHRTLQHVFAACRNESEALQQLAAENKNIHIISLDLLNTKSFDETSNKLSSILKDEGLNILFNNAGISTKFTKLNLVKHDQLLDNFLANTIAPILLTKSVTPLLKQAAIKNADKPVGVERAAVINMSSILGSIEQNDQGGFYPYRCSKAALNAATKSMSIDLKKDNIMVTSIHPGWVKTGMGGKNAPLDVDTSISGLFETLAKLSESDTGKFYQYDGKELPW